MKQNFILTQVWEGSLILDRNMGVAIKSEGAAQLEYVFKVYEDSNLKIESRKTKNNVYYFRPSSYKKYTVTVDVYKDAVKIENVTSPVLDFLEDFVLVKEANIQYGNGQVLVEVATELNLPKEYYAYYLKKNDTVIQKVFYTRQPWWRFNVSEAGEYCVQVFVRLIKNNGVEEKVIMNTKKVIV